jgi:hypothetical protein
MVPDLEQQNGKIYGRIYGMYMPTVILAPQTSRASSL